MSIRNEKGRLIKEAIDFSEEARRALEPIFDKYKHQFTYEDMYYLICTEFHEIILDELLHLRSSIKPIKE